MDEVIKAFGINTNGVSFDNMTAEERETLYTMLDAVQKTTLTPEKIKDYIRQMRHAVEDELIKTPETETAWLFFQRPNRKAVLLKARLSNLMLLDAMLSGAEQARKALEDAVSNLKT